MDSKANTEKKVAGTPAKEDRQTADYIADTPTGASSSAFLSSPDIPLTFPRKTSPPALSSKQKKASSLRTLRFGSEAPEAAKEGLASEASLSPTSRSGKRSGCSSEDGRSFSVNSTRGEEHHPDGDGKTIRSIFTADDNLGFSSPPRFSRESDITSSRSRFTPQRNLGGLFASPLPPPPRDGSNSPSTTLAADNASRDGKNIADDLEDESVMPTFTLLVPSKEPAEREQPQVASKEDASRFGEVAAALFLAPADGTAVDHHSSSHRRPTEDALKGEVAKPSSRKDTTAHPVATSKICVSNEALRSKEGDEAMCTLEILVKHTRERVGVNAFASWRVTELKRRLVYLKFFKTPEAIILAPRYGEGVLDDDMALGTLDSDVTYEARAVASS